MSRTPIRCIELVETVTAWMDAALVDHERLQVEEHIAVCPHCHDYITQLRTSIITLREVPCAAPPAAAREALLAAFRRRRAIDTD